MPDAVFTVPAMPPELSESDPRNTFGNIEPHRGYRYMPGLFREHGDQAGIYAGKPVAQTGGNDEQFVGIDCFIVHFLLP
jgi:hypothetical protein